MANTITVTSSKQGRRQFQGVFKNMWIVKGTVADQDAIAINTIGEFSVAVPGVALGDAVLAVALNNDLSDAGGDEVLVEGIVTAANVVTVRVHADTAEYAADDLNNATIKILVASPNW